MDSEKRLYPLTFLEDSSEKAWGRVSYQIADLGVIDSMIAGGWFGGNTLSELMGTYMERVVGDDSFEYYGLQFPLMVKLMTTVGWQPLQVNVGDQAAEERYDSLGRTVLWYIKEAAPGAALYLGLERDVEPGDFYSRCQDGSIGKVLRKVEPQPGDVFLIRPGTVHAAGPGLTVLEIGESSELSLTIHNWGAPLPEGEALMLEEAFDLIDFSRHSPSSRPEEAVAGGAGTILARCPEFTVTKLDLRDPLHIFSEQPGSFAIYHCLSGEALLQVQGNEGERTDLSLKPGHTVLVPSEVNDFLLIPAGRGTEVLEAMTERRTPTDSYTSSPDPHVRNWN